MTDAEILTYILINTIYTFLHSSEEDEVETASADDNFKPSTWHQYQLHKKPDRIILSKGVSRSGVLKATTSAATRFKLSSTAHLAMVATTLKSAGCDMNDVTASMSSAKRHRKSAQHEEATQIRSAFRASMPKFKVVHWDGKIVEFLGPQGRTYEDVNAVVLSSPIEMSPRFLGAPVVERGTGRQLADSTLYMLDVWDAREGIVGAVFDTTSSNTGLREGAATYLEHDLGHAMLWLACRHHIAEIHIKHAYVAIQGASKGKYSHSISNLCT